MRRPLVLMLAIAVLTSLAGCGKAGRPEFPPGTTYPKIYPDPTLGPTAAQQKKGRALPPEWDQEDLKNRFTPGGAYIDPSTQTAPNSVVSPLSNLPNTYQSQSDIFNKGLGAPNNSPLPPIQPSGPDEANPTEGEGQSQ